jgi:hypothetical protein
MKTTLFESRTPDIWITIEIYENSNEEIVIHGHDLGKRVEEIKGRREYEYFLTIEKEEIPNLTQQLNLNTKEALFSWFAINYSVHNAVSAIREKMEAMGINCSFSTW